MKNSLVFIPLAFSFTAQAIFLDAPNIKVLERKSLTYQVPPGNLFVNIGIAYEEDSEFSEQYILSQIEKSNLSFGYCDVTISSVELLKVKFNNREMQNIIDNESPYKAPVEIEMFNLKRPFDLPMSFLVKDRRGHKVAKANTQSSVARLEFATKQPWRLMENLIYINDYPDRTPNADRTYSTLAHELAHVLGDIGHIDTPEGNLMNHNDAPNTKTEALNFHQCESIRRRIMN